MKITSKILVIDDDVAYLKLVKRILGDEYDVLTAGNESTARDILLGQHIDLIILDIQMPGADGFEVYARIRKLPSYGRVPIVFATSRNDEMTERHVLWIGAADCIFKPINVEILRLRIRNLMDREMLRIRVQAQCRLLATRLEYQREIEDSLRLGASVFEHSHDAIVIADGCGQVVDVNRSFVRITGLEKNEVIGKDFYAIGLSRVDEHTVRKILNGLDSQGHWYGDIVDRRPRGETLVLFATITRVLDSEDNISHYVALFSDVTSERDSQNKLEYAAHHDVLTSLPNRVLLADRLQQAMAHISRTGFLLAVGYLDLDGFKAINDTYGHDVGDSLLIQLASRMKEALREEDTLARLGGDEFVIVAANMDSFDSILILFRRLLDIANQSIEVGEHLLTVSASIGVTTYPQFSEVEADTLIRQADQAMYRAKQQGKNRLFLFDPRRDSAALGHNELVRRIVAAHEAGQFTLYYQPKLHLKSGKVLGVEALLRWHHPETGLRLPDEFLPLIANHPFSVTLGEWVVSQALRDRETLRQQGLNMQISINACRRQILHPGFFNHLKTTLQATPGAADGLEIEIPESVIIEDFGRITAVIDQCANMGLACCIDQYGAGFSSINHLGKAHVRRLKIDRQLVANLSHEPGEAAFIKGIASMASALDIEVLAVGVESAAQQTELALLGCNAAQGNFIAPPMSLADLLVWASLRPVQE